MDQQCIPVVLNVAAGNDEKIWVGVPLPGEWELTGVMLIPNSAVSTDGSNYRTTQVYSGSTVLAAQTTNSSGGSARAEGVAQELALSGAASARLTGLSDVLEVRSTKTGTGAVDDATLLLGFERRRTVV